MRKLTLTLILIIPELFHKEQNGAFSQCFYAMKQIRDEDKRASRSTSAQPRYAVCSDLSPLFRSWRPFTESTKVALGRSFGDRYGIPIGYPSIPPRL